MFNESTGGLVNPSDILTNVLEFRLPGLPIDIESTQPVSLLDVHAGRRTVICPWLPGLSSAQGPLVEIVEQDICEGVKLTM
jgi:hypothetical protein